MTKTILKDKFSGPVLLTMFIGLINWKNTNDWVFYFCLLIAALSVLLIVNYIRKDLYIKSFSAGSECIKIQYKKNFNKTPINFALPNNFILSFNFSSKSWLEPFHRISIKYLDENGFIYKKTFKISVDKSFVELIYFLEKEKN